MLHLAARQLLGCCTILFLCFATAHAGELESSWIAQTWTSDDGLPASEVLALHQSPDGYLWIGTPGGLARFDGERFVASKKSEVPGLTSNRILSLCDDGTGGIWIGTESGGLTHSAEGKMQLTPRLQGLSSMTILSVHVDRHDNLWAGSTAGLNRWEGNRFVPYLKVDGLPDETITALADAPDGGLFIGTANGVGRYSGERFRPLEDLHEKTNGNSCGRVSALCVDKAGRVWIGAETGLYLLKADGAGREITHLLNEPVTTLLSRANGELWFGTFAGSIKCVAGGVIVPGEVYRFDSIAKALLEDHEGNVWAGTRHGLTRFKKRELHFIPSAGREIVSSYASEDGTTAQVFRDGRAQFMMAGTEAIDDWLPPTTLVKTVDGFASTVWIGTAGEGLWSWDGRVRKNWGQAEGLSDIFVEALHATSADSVWVGTRNGGLNHVTRLGVQRLLTPWGFTGNYASTIASDASGTIWIGTTGDGLFSLRNGVFTPHNSRSGLRDNRITALIAEKDGTVWAGTGAGLSYWDGTRWTSFTEKNGLPEDAVDQLQDDSEDHLWIGSGQMIYRCDKAQLRNIAEGKRTSAYIIPYGRSDGLGGASILPATHVSRNSRKDRVVFSTTRGLLVIEPAILQANTNPPPVLIQEVLVGSEAVPVQPLVEVAPGAQSIQFRYAALSFAAPEKVRFRCRLSGFDNDWIEAGGNRTMRYAKLPPGRYTFRVIAANNDGIWNEKGASVAVMVVPFWWETNWFRFGAALLTLALVLGIIAFQRQRRLEIERLRVRIAGDLHDEIGSSLWSITLLSKMLQQGQSLGEEDKRDAGEIHRIASQTSNALREIVWLINPGLDTLQDMVLRMRDFLSATVRGTEVQVSADHADLSRKLSLEVRQSYFLVFKEAVTNAARHGKAGRLEVVMTESSGMLEMLVQDDGIGFNPAEPARGHGLQSLRRRAKAIRGEIKIESAPGNGTRITMKAPL